MVMVGEERSRKEERKTTSSMQEVVCVANLEGAHACDGVLGCACPLSRGASHSRHSHHISTAMRSQNINIADFESSAVRS